MKPNLIYYIVFGDYVHRIMAQFAALSINHYTNFAGDIIILTDSDVLTSDTPFIIPNVKIINIFRHFPELRSKIKDKFNIFCMKPLISQIVNVKDYNYILYLDADTMVNYPNFQELFGFWGACGQIQVSPNGKWTVGRNVCNTGSDVLTSEEKVKHSEFGVCAGVVGFPGNELGESFCNDWWEYNKAGHFKLDDQGNLTALIIRKYLKQFRHIDFINTNKYELSGITHFHTQKKDCFWENVKFLLRKYETIETRYKGSWKMNKPSESIKNNWDFTDTMVFVDHPRLTGQLQPTVFGTFIWWQNLEGFEIVKFTDEDIIYGDSFRGGERSFTLSRIKD